ncbi:hypothetical protein D3C75_974830 [compost metagenome]
MVFIEDNITQREEHLLGEAYHTHPKQEREALILHATHFKTKATHPQTSRSHIAVLFSQIQLCIRPNRLTTT